MSDDGIVTGSALEVRQARAAREAAPYATDTISRCTGAALDERPPASRRLEFLRFLMR